MLTLSQHSVAGRRKKRPFRVLTLTDADTQLARQSLPELDDLIERHENQPTSVRLQIEGDAREVILPPLVLSLLTQALQEIAEGHSVSVVPQQTELTPNEAASVLGVSRPFLVQLLEREKIPYRRVGSHRRIRLADLLDYQAEQERKYQLLDELTAQAQELDMGY